MLVFDGEGTAVERPGSHPNHRHCEMAQMCEGEHLQGVDGQDGHGYRHVHHAKTNFGAEGSGYMAWPEENDVELGVLAESSASSE